MEKKHVKKVKIPLIIDTYVDGDNEIEYDDEEDIIIWGIFNGYLEECVEYYPYMINNK